MPIQTYPIVLKWAEMISPYVRHLAFERADKQSFDFIPGQFVTMHFEHDSAKLKRSYSIATIPNASNNVSELIEIAVARVPEGKATQILFNLEPGEEIVVSGPVGRLVLREEDTAQRYIFVATGTGVTPYRSMLTELTQRMQASDLQVALLFGVQKREDLIYKDDFVGMTEQYPHFDFQAYYSQNQPNDTENYEHQGHVQDGFQSLELNPEQDIVYLCGNPSMIDDAFAMLKDMGFGAHNVRREKYIPSR